MAKPKPRRGDVVQVELVENDRVKIRLHGHPFTYLVRVVISKETGPALAELAMLADEGAAVDYEALRAVPARRLAYTAAQQLHRGAGPPKLAGRRWQGYGGRVAAFAEDEKPPLTVGVVRAVALAERALSLGLPVRPTVAEQLQVSTRTVDRLLARAKAEGLIGPLPKRPSPKQRDTTE